MDHWISYIRPFVLKMRGARAIPVSGHHENIRQWRRHQSLKITEERRPDLFKNYQPKEEKCYTN